MRRLDLTFPELIFLVVTHVVLGAGVALLLSPRISQGRSRRVGRWLTASGLATAVPRVGILLRGRARAEREIAGARPQPLAGAAL